MSRHYLYAPKIGYQELLADIKVEGEQIPVDLETAFKIIDDFLNELPPRDKQVLNMRYGLQAEERRTLQQIGDIFGVTRERIRQIERKAASKLRHRWRNRFRVRGPATSDKKD